MPTIEEPLVGVEFCKAKDCNRCLTATEGYGDYDRSGSIAGLGE